MENTKKKLNAFSFYDRTGIEKYMKEQANEGWLLEKVGIFFWHFKKIEPKELEFSVAYFPKASVFESEPSEKQKIFQDFCEHTGWKLAASNAQMQIFYNEQKNPVPIETDAVMEVEHIHKSTKKSFLWVYIIMLLSGVFQLFTLGWKSIENPLRFFGNNAILLGIFSILLWITICLIDFGGYWRWYKKAKLLARQENRFLETTNRMGMYILELCLMLIGCGFMLVAIGGSTISVVVMVCVLAILSIVVTAIIVTFSNYMKKVKASKNINFCATSFIAIILIVALFGIEIIGIIHIINVAKESKNTAEIYEYEGAKLKAYKDEIPLKIEDLTETDYQEYSCRLEYQSESILMGILEARQAPRWDALKEPELQYKIVKVEMPFIYDWCKKEMLENLEDNYEKADASQWGATEVYQKYFDEEPEVEFVVCYDDIIIYIEFADDWELTQEQIDIVKEKLIKNIKL